MRTWIEIPASTKSGPVSVLIDAKDADAVGNRKLSIGSHGYAQMWLPERRVVLLHRRILDLRRGDRRICDHINGDGLDNRRDNLRVVDASGSSQNVRGRGYSRFRGVHPAGRDRWCAQVKFRGVTHHLGTFTCELDAARTADAKRRELMPFYVPRPEDLELLYGRQALAAVA